jgi:hypothetical protein
MNITVFDNLDKLYKKQRILLLNFQKNQSGNIISLLLL